MEKIGSICILNRGGPRRGPFFRGRLPRVKMQMDPIFSMGWMPYINRLPGKK